MINRQPRFREAGGASLFIVIFAAMLMVVVTMSFVQIMMSDQKQASTMDLSQSAYDSAQAGVEDAKRALLLLERCGNDLSAQCATARAALAASYQECNAVRYALSGNLSSGASDTAETRVVKSETGGTANDDLLDQAYTCAKVVMETDDFEADLQSDSSSVLVPLKGVEQFTKVRLSWFRSSDAGGAMTATPANPDVNFPLPKRTGTDSWALTTPSVLRTQLMQVGSAFKLDNLNGGSAGGTGAHTLFLYPAKGSKGTTGDFINDSRRGGDAAPTLAGCVQSLAGNAYSCDMTLDLPSAVPKTGHGDVRSYLYLTAMYNRTSVKVELLDASGKVVKFDGVQPIADVTGRANDVFRRVTSRIQIGGQVTYPNAALDVSGKLCKDFSVTDDAADYTVNCMP